VCAVVALNRQPAKATSPQQKQEPVGKKVEVNQEKKNSILKRFISYHEVPKLQY
jgi:hypothetical protein